MSMPGLQHYSDFTRPCQDVCVSPRRMLLDHCCLAGGFGEGSASLAFSTAGGMAHAAVGDLLQQGPYQSPSCFFLSMGSNVLTCSWRAPLCRMGTVSALCRTGYGFGPTNREGWLITHILTFVLIHVCSKF